MKNYYLTVFLVILVIIGSFLVFKDKFVKNNKTLNNLINKAINLSNSNQIGLDKNQPIESGLTLELNEPKDKAIVNSSTVTISGKTKPNVDVFINEKELKADLNGDFSIDYELFEGENNIFVAVNDSLGNYAEKNITVYLETTE